MPRPQPASRLSTETSAAPVEPARTGIARDFVGVALLVAFVAISFRDALQLPFLIDDCTFLERTRGASFSSLWGFERLAFHWYRPWSRELHFWTLQRWFGPSETAFHLASLVLGLAVLLAFAALARRVAGDRESAWATAAAAAISGWGTLLLWVSCSQDLWMLLWSLLALIAWTADRRTLALGAYVLALLSKETACLLPGIVLAWDLLMARRGARESLRRLIPMGLVSLAWATLHPQLGGRWWHPAAALQAPPPDQVFAPVALLRSLLAVINLDAWPRPIVPFTSVTRVALIPVALLVAFAWIRWSGRRVAPPAMRITAFGGVWALLGWLPQIMPGLGWHAYYVVFGALGALIAIAPWVTRRRSVALILIAVVTWLGVARAMTHSTDWGEASYLRRAGVRLVGIRNSLKRLHADFPAHSRLYFCGDSGSLAYLAGNGPSLRVWYRDATLGAGSYAAYRPRRGGEEEGMDCFFRLDSLGTCVEVVNGPEDLSRAVERNPNWVADQQQLAFALVEGGDWTAAAGCYLKLSEAHPEQPEFPLRAGYCLLQAGDTLTAARWFRHAASLPGASAQAQAVARRFGAP